MPRPSTHGKPGSGRLFKLLIAIAAVVAIAWLLRPDARAPQASLPAGGVDSGIAAGPPSTRAAPAPDRSASAATPAAVALPGFLPPEAGPVIRGIQAGAPFPHRQDGSVFGNREQRLPGRERGYYREYTVPTPGLSHRGARRIVTGGDPPREWYYSDDHYESFRAFQPPPMEARR